MGKSTWILLGVIAILILLFIWASKLSTSGYGYYGYHGYRSGPSFWYFGGPQMYHDRNLRNGSVSGPSHRGGGLRGGK